MNDVTLIFVRKQILKSNLNSNDLLSKDFLEVLQLDDEIYS